MDKKVEDSEVNSVSVSALVDICPDKYWINNDITIESTPTGSVIIGNPMNFHNQSAHRVSQDIYTQSIYSPFGGAMSKGAVSLGGASSNGAADITTSIAVKNINRGKDQSNMCVGHPQYIVNQEVETPIGGGGSGFAAGGTPIPVCISGGLMPDKNNNLYCVTIMGNMQSIS
jgi:hypothetical protein